MKSMIVVEKSDAVGLVKHYAGRYPERRVVCSYIEGGEANCIVGNILVSLGAKRDAFSAGRCNTTRFSLDGRNYNTESTDFWIYRTRDHNVTSVLPDVIFTDEAVKVFDAAQSIQDSRYMAAAELVEIKYDDGPSNYDGTWGAAGRFVEKYFGASE